MLRTPRSSFTAHRPRVKSLALGLLTFFLVLTVAAPPLSAFAQGVMEHQRPSVTAQGGGEAGRAELAESERAQAQSTQTQDSVCDNPSGVIDTAKCAVFLTIEKILEIVANLLGKLIILITDVFMTFAKYNGFADARPVQIGWKIVRDVVNMFFILIILTSAFATIVGYWEDFHYRRVLPKLLVIAVLVNFSKTLIQMLIDFSQVLMLTFVNAFQAAGAGNISQALGLTQMMQLPEPTQGDNTQDTATALGVDPNDAVNLVNIIIALMLAVFMLSIGLSVMVILTAYLIFRIIALWIALIFSPIAFFATALPDRLKRGLESFTGKYWSQLVGLLTGGPIVAFFLWLTFATISGVAEGGGLASGVGLHASETTRITSGMGNSNAIASFAIGVSMMLLALQTAVSSANALGSATLSAFTSKVSGAGMSLGRLAALSPFLLGGAAAKGAARGIDRRADITGRASRLGLRAVGSRALGWIPGLGALARPTLMKGAVMRRKEAIGEAGKELGLFADLQKYGGEELAQKVAQQYGGPSRLKELATERTSEVIKHAAGSDEFTASVVDSRILEMKKIGDYDKRIKQMTEGGQVTETDAKAAIDIEVKQDVLGRQRNLVAGELELAKSRGDAKTVNVLEKQLVSNPQLLAQEKARESYQEKLSVGDPERLKDVNEWNAYNGENLINIMKKNGVEIQNKKPVIIDPGQLDTLKKAVEKAGNAKLHEGLVAMEQMIRNSPEQEVDFYKNIQYQKNKMDGSLYAYNAKAGTINVGGKPTPVVAGERARNDKQREAYESITSDVKGGRVPHSANLMDYMAAGGTLGDLASMTQYKTKPEAIKDYAADLGVMTKKAADSLAVGDKANFTEALKPLEVAFNSLSKAGVTTNMKIDVLSQFAGNGGEAVLMNFEKMSKDMRIATLKAINEATERANDAKKKPANRPVTDGGQTDEEKKLIALVESMSEKAELRGSRMPSAVRSAFRRAGVA